MRGKRKSVRCGRKGAGRENSEEKGLSGRERGKGGVGKIGERENIVRRAGREVIKWEGRNGKGKLAWEEKGAMADSKGVRGR